MRFYICKLIILLVLLPAVTAKCDNSCYFSYDGLCDDGGKDATFADCEFGSDCRDCGVRENGEYYQKHDGSCPTIVSSADLCNEAISNLAGRDLNLTILEIDSSNHPSGCFINEDFYGYKTPTFNKKMGNTNFASRCGMDSNYDYDRICLCQYTEGESSESGDAYSGEECGVGYKVESDWSEYSSCEKCSYGTYSTSKTATYCWGCDCEKDESYYKDVSELRDSNRSKFEATVDEETKQCYRYCIYPYKARYYASTNVVMWIIIIAVILCCSGCIIRKCRSKPEQGVQMVYQQSFTDTTRPESVAQVVGVVNSTNQVQIEIPIVNKVNNDINTINTPINTVISGDKNKKSVVEKVNDKPPVTTPLNANEAEDDAKKSVHPNVLPDSYNIMIYCDNVSKKVYPTIGEPGSNGYMAITHINGNALNLETKNATTIIDQITWDKQEKLHVITEHISNEETDMTEDTQLFRVCLNTATDFKLSFNHYLKVDKIYAETPSLTSMVKRGDYIVKINDYNVDGYRKPSVHAFIQREIQANNPLSIVFRRNFKSDPSGAPKENKQIVGEYKFGINLSKFLSLKNQLKGTKTVLDVVEFLSNMNVLNEIGTHRIICHENYESDYLIGALEDAYFHAPEEGKNMIVLTFPSLLPKVSKNAGVAEEDTEKNNGMECLFVYNPFNAYASPLVNKTIISQLALSLKKSGNAPFNVVLDSTAYSKLNDCLRSNSIDFLMEDILGIKDLNPLDFTSDDILGIRKELFSWLLHVSHVLAWTRGEKYFFGKGNVKLEEVQAKIYHLHGLYRHAEEQYMRALKDYGAFEAQNQIDEMHSKLTNALNALRTDNMKKQKRRRRASSFFIEKTATGDEDVGFWEKIGKLNCAANYALMLREKENSSSSGRQGDGSVKDLLELCLFAWLGEAPKWLARKQGGKIASQLNAIEPSQGLIYIDGKDRRRLKKLFSARGATLSPVAYCCFCFPLTNYLLHFIFYVAGWLLMPILFFFGCEICNSENENMQKMVREQYLETIRGTDDEEAGECTKSTVESVGLTDCMQVCDGLSCRRNDEMMEVEGIDLYLKYQFCIPSSRSERDKRCFAKANRIANKFAIMCIQNLYGLLIFVLVILGIYCCTWASKCRKPASLCPTYFFSICCLGCVMDKEGKLSEAEVEEANKQKRLAEEAYEKMRQSMAESEKGKDKTDKRVDNALWVVETVLGAV